MSPPGVLYCSDQGAWMSHGMRMAIEVKHQSYLKIEPSYINDCLSVDVHVKLWSYILTILFWCIHENMKNFNKWNIFEANFIETLIW